MNRSPLRAHRALDALWACAVAYALYGPAPGSPAPRGATAARLTGGGEQPAVFHIPRLDAEVAVDAHLDEAVWQDALRVDLPYETEPGENVPAPVATECRLFHSRSHLSYGCRAFDPSPGEIRARLSDRDQSADGDDTVGLSVDPGFSLDRSYVFDVNALGIQNDRLYTESERNSDHTWDALWASAGRIVEGGFVVEVAIPFSSIRFPHRDGEQTWGFSLRRFMPRDVRRRLAIHPDDRNNRCRTCQHARLVGFAGIDPGLNLELTPTLTASQSSAADEGGTVDRGDPDFDPGLTLRYGLTPNLSLGATLNPDFSQVVADFARLDINEQFALFFPERRPFFLEGKDLFDTLLPAVYTRSIADPDWGAKVSGKTGRNALGAFVARDAITNLLLPGAEASAVDTLDSDSTATVLRYRRDLGRNSSSVGGLFTDRAADDYQSRLAGADARLRLSVADLLSVQFLASETTYPAGIAAGHGLASRVDGTSARIEYGHETRNWEAGFNSLDIDQGFRADLGFLPQVDIRSLRVGGQRTLHGAEDRWFTRLSFGGDLFRQERQNGEPQVSGGDVELFYQGHQQSIVELEISQRDRRYGGVDFSLFSTSIYASMRPNAAFEFGFSADLGDAIDFEGVRPGNQVALWPWLEWRVGRHVSTSLTVNYRTLEIDQGRLFRALLAELRFRYQWNDRALLRAILQHSAVTRAAALYPTEVAAESEDLFGQLLFSYKLDPQTALYVGFTGDYVDPGSGRLQRTGDTLFAKLSYAWRPRGGRGSPAAD